jgi:hypothetical protein
MPSFLEKQHSSRAGANSVITMSGSSQATAAFGAQTYQIRVATNDQPAFFTVGDGTPTADSSSMLLAAGLVDYITVSPGQKAAVLQAGTAGKISITEMS